MSDKRPAGDPHHDLAVRCEQLEREIDWLRSLLNQHGIATPTPPTVPPLTSHPKTPKKIVLFRSLFRGREDVYARRWESVDGPLPRPSWLIAKRGVNAFVIVHRQQLLVQWRERLAMFLDMSMDQIGQVGGGKTKTTGVIDVAVIRSLPREREVKTSSPSTGT